MADRVLRDHSQPCGHKTDYPDGFTTMVPYYCGHWIKGEGVWCPGGREVAIDYEAAIELARTFRNLEWNARAVRVVVDSALPDLEV